MIKNTLTQEVLILTFNGDSFPMSTGIPLEKIGLCDPKNTSAVKKFTDTREPKLVIVDGCLSIEDIVRVVVAVLAVRKRKRLDLTVCIVHQEEVRITATIWEKNPTDTQKYLREDLAA